MFIKIQYVCQGGHSGVRPRPPPFCMKSAGAPEAGAVEACNTGRGVLAFIGGGAG